MKEFKQRLRQHTRMALKEETKKMSSTAQKKKLRLKERKLKREGKAPKADLGDEDYDDVLYTQCCLTV